MTHLHDFCININNYAFYNYYYYIILLLILLLLWILFYVYVRLESHQSAIAVWDNKRLKRSKWVDSFVTLQYLTGFSVKRSRFEVETSWGNQQGASNLPSVTRTLYTNKREISESWKYPVCYFRRSWCELCSLQRMRPWQTSESPQTPEVFDYWLLCVLCYCLRMCTCRNGWLSLIKQMNGTAGQ